MRASAIQVALANMNARTTEIKHQFSPKNHVPPKYKVAYDGKHKRQYSKSHTARFKMKTVLLFQSLSNANLHKIGKWKLFYNLVIMTVPKGWKVVKELMAPTYLFLLEAKGTAKSVRVFPSIPAIATIIAHIPKAFRLKLCSSM